MRHVSKQSSQAQVHQSMAANNRGNFSCEARCLCPYGDSVWVGERSGLITVRSARTGEVEETITPPTATDLFASVIKNINNEMWIGTTNGHLVVMDVNTHEIMIELNNPEVEKNGEIFDIAVYGNSVFVATASCRVGEWDVRTKAFVKSFLLDGAVHSVTAVNSMIYAGDSTGAVARFDCRTGQIIDTCRDSQIAVTAMLYEEVSGTLWVGRNDGHLDVFATDAQLVRIDVLRDARMRINALTQIGGKVWGGGLDKTLYVWHAHTRKLLGKCKDHSAFIFSLTKLYTMETARIWSLSNDKSVNVYDGEGFFEPVTGAQGAHFQELSEAHAEIQTLRMDTDLLRKQLAVEKDKVAMRDLDVERLSKEANEQTMKLHALQHAVDKKDEALLGQTTTQNKVMEEVQLLTKKVAELTMGLNKAEQEKATLRGDIAKTQEELSRTRAQVTAKSSAAALSDTERRALAGDKDRLMNSMSVKDKENMTLMDELRRTRDMLNAKNVDVGRGQNELEMLKRQIANNDKDKNELQERLRATEEQRRRMEDSCILREHECKELLANLNRLQGKLNTEEQTLQEINLTRASDAREHQHVQDNYVLRNHEFELLKQERHALAESLNFEKQQTLEARNNETKLRMQNDELRRQLETEKNNVKLLEDQYTIFQFVINSRGELVSSIWNLSKKLVTSQKTLASLQNNIARMDPTKDRLTLKREWKQDVVDKCGGALGELRDTCKASDYIVCNYLSEFEKMHLGISMTKYPPDAQRPPVVGDQLLTKLRDVTLMKQVPHSRDSSANVGAGYMASAASTGGDQPGSYYGANPAVNPVGGAAATQGGLNASAIVAQSPAGYSMLGGRPAYGAQNTSQASGVAGTPPSSMNVSANLGAPRALSSTGNTITVPVGGSTAGLGPLPPPVSTYAAASPAYGTAATASMTSYHDMSTSSLPGSRPTSAASPVIPSAAPTAVPPPVPGVTPYAVPGVTPAGVPGVAPVVPTAVPQPKPAVPSAAYGVGAAVPSTIPGVAPGVTPAYVPSAVPSGAPGVTPSAPYSGSPAVPQPKPAVPSPVPGVGAAVPSAVPSAIPSAVPAAAPVTPAGVPGSSPVIPSAVPQPKPAVPSPVPGVTPYAVPGVTPAGVPGVAPVVPSPVPQPKPAVPGMPSAVTPAVPTAVNPVVPSAVTPAGIPGVAPQPKPAVPSPVPGVGAAVPSAVPSAIPSAVPAAAPVTPAGVPGSSPVIPSAVPQPKPAVPSPVPGVTPYAVPGVTPAGVPGVAPVVPSAVPQPKPAVPSAVPSAIPGVTPGVPTAVTPAVPSAVPAAAPVVTPAGVPGVAPQPKPAVPSAAYGVGAAVPSTIPGVAPGVTPAYVPSAVPSGVPGVTPSAPYSGSPAVPQPKPAVPSAAYGVGAAVPSTIPGVTAAPAPVPQPKPASVIPGVSAAPVTSSQNEPPSWLD